jgi:hypothetical protein
MKSFFMMEMMVKKKRGIRHAAARGRTFLYGKKPMTECWGDFLTSIPIGCGGCSEKSQGF